MIELLITFASVVTTCLFGFSIRLYPMWKTRDVKTRTIIVIYLCASAYLLAATLLFSRLLAEETAVAQRSYLLLMGIPMTIIPFFLFQKRFWQNMFLTVVSFAFNTVPNGIGNYAAEIWFGSRDFLLVVCVVSVAVAAVALPPLLCILRRLCENSSMKKADKFWRLIWLLPAMFFITAVSATGYPMGGRAGSGAVILTRLSVYAVLLLTCYLLEVAIRQACEVESAKREAGELIKLTRIKTEFMQDVSHEMRNPLTVIATGIDYTDKEINRENGSIFEASNALGIIRDETQRLGRMVEGMVTMASMDEAGENRKRVDFAALLRRGAESFRLTAEKNRNTLSAEIMTDLPKVYIETDKFTQVIANLLTNATSNTRNGKIIITANSEGSYISVCVTDTGEGISPQLLPSVFERGVSGGGGMGCGLSICKAVVEAHGGTIGIESEPGEGTAVTFTIPVYGGQEAGHQ